MYGFDLHEYARLRDKREQRRREVEQAAGWSDTPARALPRYARVHETMTPEPSS